MKRRTNGPEDQWAVGQVGRRIIVWTVQERFVCSAGLEYKLNFFIFPVKCRGCVLVFTQRNDESLFLKFARCAYRSNISGSLACIEDALG